MSNSNPTTEAILDAVTFPRKRPGEPRDISEAKFYRWLAKHDADMRADERKEWADHIGKWGSTVTDCEFTQARLVAALRGPRPFGRFAAQGATR